MSLKCEMCEGPISKKDYDQSDICPECLESEGEEDEDVQFICISYECIECSVEIYESEYNIDGKCYQCSNNK